MDEREEEGRLDRKRSTVHSSALTTGAGLAGTLAGMAGDGALERGPFLPCPLSLRVHV